MENDETGDEPSHTFQMKKSHQKQEHKNNPIRKNAPRRKNIIFWVAKSAREVSFAPVSHNSGMRVCDGRF